MFFVKHRDGAQRDAKRNPSEQWERRCTECGHGMPEGMATVGACLQCGHALPVKQSTIVSRRTFLMGAAVAAVAAVPVLKLLTRDPEPIGDFGTEALRYTATERYSQEWLDSRYMPAWAAPIKAEGAIVAYDDHFAHRALHMRYVLMNKAFT